MVDTINSEVQKSEQDPYVELWQLDLTVFDDQIYYFVRASLENEAIVWDGETYQPFDIEADGFEWNGQGSIPTPRIRFSTTNVVITGFIYNYNDLCGATLTRIRTYRKFMDGQSHANTSEYFSKDTYRINTKVSENKYQVEFELSSPLDQQGVQLPRGQIVPYCRAIYRKWNGSTWVIHPSDLACPYSGSNYFTVNNVSTADPAQDKCNHLVTGCKARFTSGDIPMMGFPGTQRPVTT